MISWIDYEQLAPTAGAKKPRAVWIDGRAWKILFQVALRDDRQCTYNQLCSAAVENNHQMTVALLLQEGFIISHDVTERASTALIKTSKF